ncbi:MAG TPA: ABC transporter permease [Bacilli bacterium]|nr:ABC transporter permease [Bacilli bacterium]
MINYKEYKKRKKIYNFSIIFVQVLVLISFILIWQLLSDNKIINSFIFSSPKKVYLTIIDLYQNEHLLSHIWITTYETLISFILGTIIGIVVATIMWMSKFFAKVISPYLTIINSLPKVALGPIIVIWFGSSINSIVIMALLISTIITIINVYQAFINIDKIKIKLMKSLKASKFFIYKNLILPGSKKVILNTLVINISMSLIGVIMGEFLVSKQGIGYLIMYGSQIFNLNLVISGIVILCIISAIMYYIISFIEKKLVSNN